MGLSPAFRCLLCALAVLAAPARAQRNVWRIPVPEPAREFDPQRPWARASPLYFFARWDRSSHSIVAVADDELVRIDPLRRSWTLLAKLQPPRPERTDFRRCPVRALAVDREGVVDLLQMLPVAGADHVKLTHQRLLPGETVRQVDDLVSSPGSLIHAFVEFTNGAPQGPRLTADLAAGPAGERYILMPWGAQTLPALAPPGAERGDPLHRMMLSVGTLSSGSNVTQVPQVSAFNHYFGLGAGPGGDLFVLTGGSSNPGWEAMGRLVHRTGAGGPRWTYAPMEVTGLGPTPGHGRLPKPARLACAEDGRVYLLDRNGADNLLELAPRTHGGATTWEARPLLKSGLGITESGPFPMPVEQFKPTIIHDLEVLPSGALLLTTASGLFFVDPPGERSLAGRVQAYRELRARGAEAAAAELFQGVQGWVRPTGRVSGASSRNHDAVLARVAKGGLAREGKAGVPSVIQAGIADFLLDPVRHRLPAALALLAMDEDKATGILWPSAEVPEMTTPAAKRARIDDWEAPFLTEGLGLEPVGSSGAETLAMPEDEDLPPGSSGPETLAMPEDGDLAPGAMGLEEVD